MTDWTELAVVHGPAVWKTAVRLVGSDADAADCFQDAFLAAVRIDRAGRVQNWGALLRHLAVARGLDLLRRRRRELARRARAGPEPPADPSAGPFQEAQREELAQHLRIALASLPRREAEVFCLRCMEECTYDEIASRLGLRVNAVGVLLHRARRRLRTLLESDGGREG
jgi:RNA polymerase sigma-70 factor, ECF subfamily